MLQTHLSISPMPGPIALSTLSKPVISCRSARTVFATFAMCVQRNARSGPCTARHLLPTNTGNVREKNGKSRTKERSRPLSTPMTRAEGSAMEEEFKAIATQVTRTQPLSLAIGTSQHGKYRYYSTLEKCPYEV